SLAGLAAGAYSVTVTDDNGCVAATSAAVSNVGGPSAVLSALNHVSCAGGNNGSASVAVSGGTPPFFYSWFPSGGNSPNASGLAAGNYAVNIRDGNNCLTSIPVQVNQPSVLIVAGSATAANCYNNNNGSVSVSASGGTGPYAYSWSPGGGTQSSMNSLSAGTYVATVTDNNGCQQNSTVTVSQPPLLAASLTSVSNIDCYGNTNGSASVGASGGTSP